MQRWGKRLLWIGGGLVLALIALFLFFVTIPSHKITQSLQSALAKNFNSKITVGKASVHFFPRPHYLLQKVQLSPNNLPLITGPCTIEEISGSFAWWPVLTKATLETQPVITGLRLQLDLSGASPILPQAQAAQNGICGVISSLSGA